MMGKYILDSKHNLIPCNDIMEWGRWFQDATVSGERFVAKTTVREHQVSTVFLGLDHRYGSNGPPIVFETMIFPLKNGERLTIKESMNDEGDQKFSDYQERYSTWEEAEAGHKTACEYITNSL